MGHAAQTHADAGCREAFAANLNELPADDFGRGGGWRHGGRIEDLEGVAIAGRKAFALQAIHQRCGQIDFFPDGHIDAAPVPGGFGDDTEHLAGRCALCRKLEPSRAELELKAVQRQIGKQVGARVQGDALDHAHGVDPHNYFFFQFIANGFGKQTPVREADPALVLENAHPGIPAGTGLHRTIGQGSRRGEESLQGIRPDQKQHHESGTCHQTDHPEAFHSPGTHRFKV